MEKTAGPKTFQIGRQKMEEAIRCFIGSVPVQTMLEISGGAFPFLRDFAPLYVQGLAMGFDHTAMPPARSISTGKGRNAAGFSALLTGAEGAAGQVKAGQRYDIIFVHSIPPAAMIRRNFAHEILPHLLRAMPTGGKMLLMDYAAEKPQNRGHFSDSAIPVSIPLCSKKALREILRKAELDLVKTAEFPASEADCAAVGEIALKGRLIIYFIRNPQILMA